LEQAEQRDPDRTLLRWRGNSWSVREFASMARRMAAHLAQLGVECGDRVAIAAATSEWYAAAVYGIHGLGATAVPINMDLRGPLLKHVIEDADPGLLLVEPGLRELIVTAGVTRELTPFDTRTLAADLGTDELQLARPAPADLASIIHTSGTTGPSKGVMLSHGYFVNCAAVWARVYELEPDDVIYWVFPSSHVDFYVELAIAIQTGATLAFVPRFSRSRFWDDVIEFQATAFGAVGWMLSVLAQDGPPARRSEIRLARGVACPISADNYAFFEDELGIQLLEIYGQTEANSPCFGTLSRRKRGTAGWPCAGFDVEIHDASGASLPAGQQGEIVYRPGAPNMMTHGYWRREAATVEAARDLWFHSGDLGHFDDEGYLWFDGRLKDVIRCRGENVSAFELETTLREAPGVLDCVAVPFQAETGGEDDIRILVVPSGRVAFDVVKFFEYCDRHLARFSIPRYVEVIEESDLTRSRGSGAVQKDKLPTELGPGTVDRLTLLGDGGLITGRA
jgi:crotonobetaine/carnitine-CoA ligase